VASQSAPPSATPSAASSAADRRRPQPTNPSRSRTTASTR
jgi:hypothetical protein